jgi:16S rRNA (uracil1498-N3)-methyltransferase
MSQSGRITAPVVEGPTTYAAVLAAPKPGFMKRILIPGPYPSLLEVGDFSAPALLLIGPEGGFTESEEQAAFTAGFSPAALSGSSLRAETAALCAAAIVAAARYAADRRETALAPR